jgi:hypothetical protein
LFLGITEKVIASTTCITACKDTISPFNQVSTISHSLTMLILSN